MQLETAHASGIGLREIARNMGIPAGTILSRAKREGWTGQIRNAKALTERDDTTPTVAPFEAVAATLSEHGKATRFASAKAHRKATEHAARLSGGELMNKDTAQALKHHVQAANIVHGWYEQTPEPKITVNVLGYAAVRLPSREVSE